MRIRQGHICLVALDPTVANEQSGSRPCIVVSTDRFNFLPIRHAIVVPVTSRDRGLPHHVPVADDGGLDRPSWAMCEAVRAVSTVRFDRLISTADKATTDAITRHIVRWLGQSS